MKVKDLISLFSLLAVFLFTACSDDDDNTCSYLDLLTMLPKVSYPTI